MNKLFVRMGFLCALFAASNCLADVLDQVSDVGPVEFYEISRRWEPGQSFTAGLSGRLSRIELKVQRMSEATALPLKLEMRAVEPNWYISETILGSVTLEPAHFPLRDGHNDPGYTSIDVRAMGIDVQPGDRLAIVLRSDEAFSIVTWIGYRAVKSRQGEDIYSGGHGGNRRTGSGDIFSGVYGLQRDLAFRTYVVPEPAGLGALILAGAVLTRRRGG